MITNPRGGYSFLPGSTYLSFAAVAQPGYALERAIFRTPRPLDSGFEAVQKHLASLGRPAQALCGLEFRQYSSLQWPRPRFDEFNMRHAHRLENADMLVGGKVPVARTNVVLNTGQPEEEGGLHAFTYTVPAARPAARPDFLLAAIPEVRFLPGVEEVIAKGETSPEALHRKIRYILDTATARLAEMGVSWDDATGIQLYSEADLKPIFKDVLLAALKAGGWRGVQWHHALPPVGPSIIELDARSVRADITLE
ncbi:MAG: hypothetical protein EPN76_11630 [Burkholderiaceae bacterium]|nr:MAG: hypothetical protein EPN76_11630 [Burkholderiaceae bacterium]TAM02674.1 MAG: hypothetical protein EPN67_10690 [Pusillimonas sp.]